ncbi:MAG: RNA-guided pseudouridylation complex pseudouridine synthase subunit Cbf5 [Candidatus Burarchaeum sp.]|nr:RNA-guided pseudouridylation complex pseudouridine synthase subunit Cbf5 [Candidatus Burarchaeum sp.]MDO8339386.1 RNA-guided pseudouridylation complex pseudouridine synthase subunit Cbf5 [Candidatus Burarchaeum sp.]
MVELIEHISAETDPSHGKVPRDRTMAERMQLGIIPINKPCGPSSHEVGAWVQRLTGAIKAGHSGTLDPQVSGVLPVALDDATKALTFMLKSDKEYVGIMRFHRAVDAARVRRLFAEHVGKIKQLPPVRSAVKRVQREREIYVLELLELDGRDALFHVSCEAGTYIRKLCHDLGRSAGTGANMVELRRTRAAGFSEVQCCTLQQLSDALWLWKERGDESELRKYVLQPEQVLKFKRIIIVDGAIEALCAGAQLALPGVAKFEKGIARNETVMLLSLKGEMVAIGAALMSEKEMKEGTKGLAVKTVRVVMRAGTYPRLWKKHEGSVHDGEEGRTSEKDG